MYTDRTSRKGTKLAGEPFHGEVEPSNIEMAFDHHGFVHRQSLTGSLEELRFGHALIEKHHVLARRLRLRNIGKILDMSSVALQEVYLPVVFVPAVQVWQYGLLTTSPRHRWCVLRYLDPTNARDKVEWVVGRMRGRRVVV